MENFKLTCLIISFLFSCLSAKAQTSCAAGQKKVEVQLKTNEVPFDNGYLLRNSAGDTLLYKQWFLSPDSLHIDSICVDTNECLTFIATDRWGDGLCCNQQIDGYYKILIDNELQAEGGMFGNIDFAFIDCGQGEICNKAKPISLGVHETPVGLANNWYEFTADTSGLFNISTCFSENACNTTIWAYEYCSPINEFSTIQGTNFFAEDNCNLLAETSARLIKGSTYYFRIGSSTDDCRNQPIKWELKFLRAITGCMDSLACNFSPTATINDNSCLFAGDPNCPNGPDLVMVQQAFESSLYRDEIDNSDQCLREEGCLTGYGNRTVIRFRTEILNAGEKDFFIGAPPADIDAASIQWEYDQCHNHWHYEGYARYVLFDENGVEIPIGAKNGFCVLDLECPSNITEKYTCEFQGLTAGCRDIYEPNLDCQYIDITDVPDGKYTLVSVVNWDHSPDATGNFETDYGNNWAQVCIEITRSPNSNFIGFQKILDCDTYVDCLGIPNGTATFDCEGNCNGSVQKGDIVRDNSRDLVDVNEYILASLEDQISPTDCNDLNLDGEINVADAALILECVLHEGAPPQPGHSHSPCEFTVAIQNPFDSVWLQVGTIDGIDEFVDIQYLAPYGRLEAFEFELEGIKIKSVQSLNPNFKVTIDHDESEILGLSFEENSLPRTIDFQAFIRVFYEEKLSDTICIGHVEALVNEDLELMQFAGGNCNYLNDSGTHAVPRNDFYSTVIPNPLNGTGQLIFDNQNRQSVRVEFFSLSGKRLKTVPNFRGNSLLIDNQELSTGVVLYRIVKKDGISVGKIIAE